MVLKRYFKRNLDRGRAVVGIKYPVERPGKQVRNQMREPQCRLADKSGHEYVLDGVELFFNGSGDGRVVMAETAYPPRSDRVDIVSSFIVEHMNAAAPADDQRRTVDHVLIPGKRHPDMIKGVRRLHDRIPPL
jgi:hypothetical protein